MRTFRRALVLLLLIAAPFALPQPSMAQVSISVTVAPPPLPVYAQPPIPAPGWIWTPGYWAWGPYGYYWVPGTWVLPPRVGLLWTPGWWGWEGGRYFWHAGYWGPHVGFYGGINYGFGYFGVGYVGGFWDHDRFHYNRAYNNIRNVHVTNVYNRTYVMHNVTRTSFNGGRGIAARPTPDEERFARERHFGPTAMQNRHANVARGNLAQRASFNHGRPHIAATIRPGAFTGRGVVHAQGSVPYRPQPRPAVHRANAPGPRRPAPAQRGPEGGAHPGGDQHHEGGGPGGPPHDNGGPDHQHP
jgi:hypothetical protein